MASIARNGDPEAAARAEPGDASEPPMPPSRSEALRDVYLFLRGLAEERRARLAREAAANAAVRECPRAE